MAQRKNWSPRNMTPQQQRESLARFVLGIAYDTFAPGMSPEEFLEKISEGGHHHLLMQKLWPASEDLNNDAYGESLGEFEGELLGWLQEMQEDHLFYKTIEGLPGKVRVRKMNAHHKAQKKKYHWRA